MVKAMGSSTLPGRGVVTLVPLGPRRLLHGVEARHGLSCSLRRFVEMMSPGWYAQAAGRRPSDRGDDDQACPHASGIWMPGRSIFRCTPRASGRGCRGRGNRSAGRASPACPDGGVNESFSVSGIAVGSSARSRRGSSKLLDRNGPDVLILSRQAEQHKREKSRIEPSFSYALRGLS